MSEAAGGIDGQNTYVESSGTGHGDELAHQGALAAARHASDPDDVSTTGVGVEETESVRRPRVLKLCQGDEPGRRRHVPPPYAGHQGLGIVRVG
jgi:hypothetical protein